MTEGPSFDDGAFWATEEPLALVNPRLPAPERLAEWLQDGPGAHQLQRHVLFATSGSTGAPKWVALSKHALLLSAWAVNDHLKATRDDLWFRALPSFHVGGFGIHARAMAGRQRPPVVMAGKWSVGDFLHQITTAEATLTSLVPTQVYDLVQAKSPAPPTLRAVVVGGGEMRPALAQAARELGWPLLQSYGMTEAASQIATQPLSTLEGEKMAEMHVLNHWDPQIDPDGRLQLSGAALFTGYVERARSAEGSDWRFTPSTTLESVWWTSADRAELTEHAEPSDGQPRRVRTLRFCGRCDDVVKIRGEIIDLHPIHALFADAALAYGVTGRVRLAVLPDERIGHRLELRSMPDPAAIEAAATILAEMNHQLPPFAQISKCQTVDSLPTSDLGKALWA